MVWVRIWESFLEKLLGVFEIGLVIKGMHATKMSGRCHHLIYFIFKKKILLKFFYTCTILWEIILKENRLHWQRLII
jgi:hypothetical protein